MNGVPLARLNADGSLDQLSTGNVINGFARVWL
jgi:hypothetical protein